MHCANVILKPRIILLELVAVCHYTESDFVMYFTVNTTFVNYLPDLIDSLDISILQNWTTHEEILPISLHSFDLNSDLLKAPKMLNDFVHQFQHKKKKFLICKKGIMIIMIWI